MIQPDRLTGLTQKVLGMNSENPPGNEWALGKFIERQMKALRGVDVKTYEFAPRRPNVIAVLKGAAPRRIASERSILITPHYDTVPVGGGWLRDPWGRDIIQGRIYGRGASDDKGNTAVAMEVVRSIVEDRRVLNHDLILAATVDEETGSQAGIVPLLEKRILRPGYGLILDSDEGHAIIAQKGLIHARVRIFGKKAHGAYNWRGVNAIEIAARVIERIKRHRFAFKRHPLLQPPTVNIGTIRGGDKVNMVADLCEFSVDLRYLPGTRGRDVLAQIRKIIAMETRKFEIVIDDMQSPYEIPANDPFVRHYLEQARALRCRAEVRGSEGATVMTFFQRYGIPAFATGYGASGTAHATDEYARVSTLIKGAQLLERFIIQFDRFLAEGKK